MKTQDRHYRVGSRVPLKDLHGSPPPIYPSTPSRHPATCFQEEHMRLPTLHLSEEKCAGLTRSLWFCWQHMQQKQN